MGRYALNTGRFLESFLSLHMNFQEDAPKVFSKEEKEFQRALDAISQSDLDSFSISELTEMINAQYRLNATLLDESKMLEVFENWKTTVSSQLVRSDYKKRRIL